MHLSRQKIATKIHEEMEKHPLLSVLCTNETQMTQRKICRHTGMCEYTSSETNSTTLNV